jgi:glycosyl transferase family 25
MWDFIDKAVYINLDHREDRRQIMNHFFQEAGIPLEKTERFSAIRHAVGIVGCAMGHIEILKKAKREGWKSVLILEDDMKWVPDSYTRIEKLVTETPNWDVCMLTGLYMESTPPKVQIAFCTNAYIVKQHYYDTLLNNFETGLTNKLNIRPSGFLSILRDPRSEKMKNMMIDGRNQYNVDVYWFKLQMRDNWIAMFPPACDQLETYSDIYNSVKKHTMSEEVKQELYKAMVLPVKQGLKDGNIL